MTGLAQDGQDANLSRRQRISEQSRHGLVQQGERHAHGGLLIDRIDQPDLAHVLEHPADALPKLPRHTHLGESTGNPWIPGEPGDGHGLSQVGQAGEPSRAGNFDSVASTPRVSKVATPRS
jgi:hypothetical protein